MSNRLMSQAMMLAAANAAAGRRARAQTFTFGGWNSSGSTENQGRKA